MAGIEDYLKPNLLTPERSLALVKQDHPNWTPEEQVAQMRRIQARMKAEGTIGQPEAGVPTGRRLIHGIPIAAQMLGAGGTLALTKNPLWAAGAGIAASATAQPAADALDKYFYPEETKNTPFEPGKSALKGAGMAALAEGIGLAAPFVAKHAISVGLGPRKYAIDEYLENAPRINKAPTMVGLKDKLDARAKQIVDAVAAKQMTYEEAQLALRDLKKDMGFNETTHGNQFSSNRAEAKAALDKAEAEVQHAHEQVMADHENQFHPQNLDGRVVQSIGQLKQKLISSSEAATQVLADSGSEISTKGLADIVQKEIDALNIKGKVKNEDFAFGGDRTRTVSAPPVGGSAEATKTKLEALKSKLDTLPDTIAGEEAKKLIQQLDHDVVYNRKPGDFSPVYDSTVKSVRKQVDNNIKFTDDGAKTAYAKAMEPVAETAKTLEAVNDTFNNGDLQATRSKLSNIHEDVNKPTREVLKKLGQETGNPDFDQVVENYGVSQKILKDPSAQNAIRESLPEYEKYQDRSTNFASEFGGSGSGKSADVQRYNYIQDKMAEDYAKRAQLEADLASKKADYSQADQEASRYSGITTDTSEKKILEYMQAGGDPQRKIEQRRKFEELSPGMGVDEEGRDFQQQMNDRQVLNEFQRGNVNGSRNVNLYKSIGSGVGGVVGTGIGTFSPMLGPYTPIVGSAVGGAAGAMTGAVVDKYGPQMAKGVLDAYMTPIVRPVVNYGTKYAVPAYLQQPGDNAR